MNIRITFLALVFGLIMTVPAYAGPPNHNPNCVPEPATLGLVLLGLLPLARRRKN
jgi:hypothetical protein